MIFQMLRNVGDQHGRGDWATAAMIVAITALFVGWLVRDLRGRR